MHMSAEQYFISVQVASCDCCQRPNFKLQRASDPLHPILVTPKIWSKVGLDLIGSMPETPRGNKYILSLADYSGQKQLLYPQSL